MSRKKNGDGHTYEFRKGYRTVIKVKGIPFSATGKTQAEAKRNAKAKVKQANALNWGASPRGGKIPLDEFLMGWLEHEHQGEIAPSTYTRYVQLAKFHILPELGSTALVKIDRNAVNRLLETMERNGQSKRSIRQARALLSVCLNAAISYDLIGANPVGASRKIRIDRHEVDTLTREEVARVIQWALNDTMKLRLELALLYGLRQGEALGLRWRDINVANKTMSIAKQAQTVDGERKLVDLKSDSSYRTLALDEETLGLLRSQRASVAQLRLKTGTDWEHNDLVLPGENGKPMASRWDYEQWHQALDNAGLPRRRLHDARHTCATLLLEDGVDIEVIRRYLGHSSVELTSRTYLHKSAKTVTRVSEAVSRIRQTEGKEQVA